MRAANPSSVRRPWPLAILGWTALLTATGCYDPTTVDCAVACGAPGECAAGQVCGSDGFCAAPGVAGTCGSGGGEPTTVDAAPRALHLVVEGRGRVFTSDAAITCEGEQNQPGDCWFEVTDQARVTFVAASTHQHWQFTGWDEATCGSAPICAVAVTADTVLTARFARP